MAIQIRKQLALFLDNRPGTLARCCQALADKKVNIIALSVSDTVDHAIVRMVVDNATEAESILSSLHAAIQTRDVIVMDLLNTAGELAKIAESLVEAGINIEYAYCTGSPDQQSGTLVLRTNDLEQTINALS